MLMFRTAMHYQNIFCNTHLRIYCSSNGLQKQLIFYISINFNWFDTQWQ